LEVTRDTSPLHSAQTGSGAYTTSYTKGIGGYFLRVKGLGRESDLHLVLRSIMMELYLSSATCLQVVVLN
jgi:hypothetical protein